MGWNDDGIHKRGKYYHVCWRDADGTPHEKSSRSTDYRVAQAFRREMIERAKQGALPNDQSKWTLSAAIETFLEHRKATMAKRTAQVEKTLLTALKGVIGPQTRLQSITAQTLRDYQTKRARMISATMKRPVQARTINYELYLLRLLLERANLWHGTLATQYKRLRQPKATCGRAITAEQFKHLAQTARTKDIWTVAFCATVLAYATGCRGWELKTLRLGDINLGAREITIKRENAKGRYSRVIALNAIGVGAVEALVRRAVSLGASAPEHYLFPQHLSKHTKAGDPLKDKKGFDPERHQGSWSSAWRSLRTKAGLEGFRFHDLRHTYCTQAAEAGVPMPVLMAQVGHLSSEMLRHYTHVSTRAQHSAVHMLEAPNAGLMAWLPTALSSTAQSAQSAQSAQCAEAKG